MTDQEQKRIAEIEARCAAATQPPWEGRENEGVVANGKYVFETGCGCCTGSRLSEEDAAFIGNSRQDIPFLLTLVHTLTAQLAEKTAEAEAKYGEVIDVGAVGWCAGFGQCSGCGNGLPLDYEGYCGKCGIKIVPRDKSGLEPGGEGK